jgi:hypothetical protein
LREFAQEAAATHRPMGVGHDVPKPSLDGQCRARAATVARADAVREGPDQDAHAQHAIGHRVSLGRAGAAILRDVSGAPEDPIPEDRRSFAPADRRQLQHDILFDIFRGTPGFWAPPASNKNTTCFWRGAKKRMQWNEEQASFIRQPLTSGSLIGLAGCGKSKSIVGRLLHWMDEGSIEGAHAFVVLTFSRAACADFRAKGAALRPGVFDTDNVRTIHSLAGTIRQGAGETSSLQTVVYRATKTIATMAHGDACAASRVRHIVVDEAQDISRSQYEFVMCLADRLGASVVMAGDPNQSIYGFQGGDDRFLREHPGWRVHLRRNYRSNPGIVRVANIARPWAEHPDMISMSGGGPPRPVLVTASQRDVRALETRLMSIVRSEQERDGLRSFAVIGPIKRGCTDDGNFWRIGLQWVVNVLDAHDIPYAMHYDETRAGADGARGAPAAACSGRVQILTVHAAKGLEFDTVVVVNFHDNATGMPASLITPQTRHDWQCLWYVALSRARTRLVCVSLREREVFSFRRRDGEARDLLRAMFRVSDDLRVASSNVTKKKKKSGGAQKQPEWAWTDLLNDRTLVDERTLCIMEDDMLGGVTTIDPGTDSPGLEDHAALASLYGEWAENYFEYCYRKQLPSCFWRILMMVDDVVVLPSHLHANVRRFLYATGGRAEHLCVADLVSRADAFGLGELVDIVRARGHASHVHLYVENDCKWFDPETLMGLMTDWQTRRLQLTPHDVWTMCLFLWQYRCEAKYRWIHRQDPVLEPFANNIKRWAEDLEDGWRFQVNVQWHGLPINGIIDALHGAHKHIIEFKFSTAPFQTTHALQVLGYAHMHAPDDAHAFVTTVWNLYNGERTECRGTHASNHTHVHRELQERLSSRSRVTSDREHRQA